jgi:amino acid transporter
MSTIAGELEDPQVIPKATLITVPLIMATYILPTSAALASLHGIFPFGDWGEGAGDVGYHTVAMEYWGMGAGMFFIVVAVVAQFSIYNTYIASGSRGFFALAEDNLAPPIMVKVSKKRGVPYVAVLSVAIVNLILCNFAFTTVVVVDVFLLVSSYIMVYISILILRKRFDPSMYEGKFKIPGGYGFLVVLCIVPICVALFSFFVNGTDYFIGGMVGIVSGPVLYYIWRRMYGGLSKKDPVKYPVNPKTGLGNGDTTKMAFIFAVLTAIGAIGYFFLPWYEGTAGGWSFPDDYDMTIFGSQEAMWTAILIATIVCAVLAVIFFLISRAVEPKKK